MKLKTLIVDDEPLAREGVVSYAEDVDFIEIAGQCKNALEANQFIVNHPTDLMFLDIEMPKLAGTDFLRSIEQKPLVILTTAYPQYALEGFELDVVDYLVKPYSFERFLKAANRAFERYGSSNTGGIEQDSGKDIFFVKSDRRYIRVLMDSVRYIQGNQNYVDIYTEDDKIMTLMTLKKLEKMLPSDKFARIHKSYIVALRSINQIDGNRVLVGDEYLPVSKKRKEKLLEKLLK